MEIEKDNIIPFLGSQFQGIQTISSPPVFTESPPPPHTDQYLAYNSHHPQSVKRGIVKCLNTS